MPAPKDNSSSRSLFPKSLRAPFCAINPPTNVKDSDEVTIAYADAVFRTFYFVCYNTSSSIISVEQFAVLQCQEVLIDHRITESDAVMPSLRLMTNICLSNRVGSTTTTQCHCHIFILFFALFFLVAIDTFGRSLFFGSNSSSKNDRRAQSIFEHCQVLLDHI